MPFLLPLLLAQAAAPAPFTPEQAQLVQCVATLSIVANEQQRNVPASLAYPPLAETGADFAQVVGERLMAETGRSKEAMRDAFIAGVATQQARVKADPDLKEVPRAEVMTCLALMDGAKPDVPPPTLPQCAAMVRLASEEVKAGEGLTGAAKNWATIASVLDARARSELGASGKSGPEIDVEMVTTREAIAAEALRREAEGVSAGLNFEACFAMARE